MQAYKIINFDKTIGSIVVEFAPDMAPVAIDLPIGEDGNYITGSALDEYVQGFIPTWFIERKAKIAAGIPNEAEIEALVQAPAPVVVEADLTTEHEINGTTKAFMEYEAEKMIAKALVKWGVLNQDPTEIASTTL